jgi:hypothetical protein
MELDGSKKFRTLVEMRRSMVYGGMITFANALRGRMDCVNDPQFSLNPI